MSEMVRVGRVGRPHGLRGAFVVEEASEDPERFAPGTRLFLDGEPVRVLESKLSGGRVVITLDQQPPRGGALTVPKSELPPPEEGSYYVADLIGLDVVEEGGRSLGCVHDVTSGVANDVIQLESGTALPMVEECILSVDLGAGRVLVAQGFAD